MQQTPSFIQASIRGAAPILLLLLIALGAPFTLHAGVPTATAQISDVPLLGGTFAYTITLENTGTTTIGTFWNAWIPGQDYLAVSPTNIISPTGWSANITNGGSEDGFAIQWIASSNLLQPDDSDTFTFDSTVTPTAMDGDSVFYPTTPVETSFVYSGAPFSDAGDDFVVQPASVPEPSSVPLGILGALGVLAVRLRRKRLMA